MKTPSYIPSILVVAVIAAPALTITQVQAGTFSSSTSAPTVAGNDIANLATSGNDKWFNDGGGKIATAAKGQTFTTGNTPVLFKAITYKCDVGNMKAASVAKPTTYTVRVGTVSGTVFTQMASETVNQTVSNAPGSYMTWTFASQVLLSANTTYAVDVAMTVAGEPWQSGIPYLSISGNGYAGGQFYNSGTNGVGNASLAFSSGNDRTFHLHLQDPMTPSPESGATVGGGNVPLGWTNIAPTTGSDVWVDVWFGTNPAALTKVVSTGLNTTSYTANATAGGTYYWRIDSYLNGTPTGTPVTGTLFNFVITDTDGDGIPDAWLQQYFGHPNGMAGDLSRAQDDADNDGLTNLQEYQLGTNPINPDTDGDGLKDGVETRTGIWVSATNTGTDPLKADSDGDGLSDGVESNTGIWVSAANTGTNPNNPDTDGDGLKDGVETKTGTYVSATNTGTSPLNPDSDGDGAGDWYEVVTIDKNPALDSPPNTPNNASLKPNIPYPLPAPDASSGVTNKPVKVYIMSGQSNMVGNGQIAGSGPGTLQTITGAEHKFPNLVASGGGWTTRNDVKYRGVITDIGNGPLKADVAGATYGPELGFGYVMGYSHDEPVLLIKASQGNRGLMWDILPPGSPRTVYGATTYPAYGESPETWATATGGPTPFVWYAGKQYDDFFLKENDMGPSAWANAIAYPANCEVRNNGVTYISKSAHTSTASSAPGVGVDSATFWNVYSVFNTADVLDNFAAEYPQWAAQGFQIAGFVWWQGYDDTGEPRATRYEPNLVQFIKQVRTYYENRYPTKIVHNAPFVLATLATNGGWGNTDTGSAKVAQAQLNVDGAAGNYPEFVGNVKTMEARGFWRDAAVSPNAVGYHYNFNAETYMLVGDALGRAMVDLESATPPASAYANWAAGPFSGTLSNSNPTLDFDGGGLETGIEWAVGGDPTTGSDDVSKAPVFDNTTDPEYFIFTYRRSDAANADANTTIAVQYGSDLNGWTKAVNDGTNIIITSTDNGAGPAIDLVQVKIKRTLAAGGKFFVRLNVAVSP